MVRGKKTEESAKVRFVNKLIKFIKFVIVINEIRRVLNRENREQLKLEYI